jgi:hypothetical protein
MRLELGEGHFDGIEIGAVGRQEEESSAAGFQDGGGLWAFVAGEIVKDDHVATLKRRSELGFDIGLEDVAVDRPLDHPGRGQAIMAQRRDERLGAPMTKGRFHFQPMAPARPAAQPCHLGRGTGLVDKDQPFRALLHPWLAVFGPYPSGTDDISAIGFARQQRF